MFLGNMMRFSVNEQAHLSESSTWLLFHSTSILPALEIIDDKCSMLPGEGETKLCQVISYTATGWECDEGPVIFSEWSVER